MTDPGGEREETFMSHLVELRGRLLRAVLAVLAGFLALLPFSQRTYSMFAEPLIKQLPAGGQIIAIDVASPFLPPSN